jgi:Phasin protein
MSVDPMQKFGKENIDMAMNAFGAWAKNAQAIATEVADYSKKSFEDSAAAFEKFIAAKSLKRRWKCRPNICDRRTKNWSPRLPRSASCTRTSRGKLTSRSKAC